MEGNDTSHKKANCGLPCNFKLFAIQHSSPLALIRITKMALVWPANKILPKYALHSHLQFSTLDIKISSQTKIGFDFSVAGITNIQLQGDPLRHLSKSHANRLLKEKVRTIAPAG